MGKCSLGSPSLNKDFIIIIIRLSLARCLRIRRIIRPALGRRLCLLHGYSSPTVFKLI